MNQVQKGFDQYAQLKAKKELSPEEKAVVEAFLKVKEAEAVVVEKAQDATVAKANEVLEAAQQALEDKPSTTV